LKITDTKATKLCLIIPITSNQQSFLLPIGSDTEMLSPDYISIQKISELAIENDGAGTNQNFLIFDAFFEARSSNLSYQKSINQSLISNGMTLSAYDAKDDNLIGDASGFIPFLIDELADYQPITETFSKLDKATGSISRANTSGYTGEIFRGDTYRKNRSRWFSFRRSRALEYQ